MRYLINILVFSILLVSCNVKNQDKKSEQLTINEIEDDNRFDSLKTGLEINKSFNQFNSTTNKVLLTGLNNIRLINIYKIKPNQNKYLDHYEGTTYDEYSPKGQFRYFMPGIDVIRGYNLINIAHYNLEKDKLSYFFQKPVLVRNLYFPGVKRDSLNGQLIQRNFFMATVYDEDTNNDSLINKKDIRKMYHFDELNTQKIQLIPSDFSPFYSTYDYKNDILYVYTREDKNKNGKSEKEEPIAVFYIRLSNPTVAKRMI